MEQYNRLLKIIKKLRDPDHGCPWDRVQTHHSLEKFLIEESYEFINAIEEGDPDHIKDELGDVLLQVVLHAAIGEEKGEFNNMEDVCKNLCEKLIKRHPHVFDSNFEHNITTDQVKKNWQKIKNEERHLKTKIESTVLDFPALFSANKIGEKTNRIGFDWGDEHQVEEVMKNEWQEFKAETTIERMTEEFGDFLFSAAQVARHNKINPEIALRMANEKFMRRFHKMEELIEEAGKNIDDMNQLQMDKYWQDVKRLERSKND